MKTPTLLLSLTLSLVTAGCIDTKDVGVESDSSSGGSSSEDSGASMTSGASAAGSTSGSASDTATSTTTTAGSESGDTEAGVTSLVIGTDSSGGTESSTGSDTDGGEDQVLCEDSGGLWEVMSCGHYMCGLPPECAAIVPGCDCGEHQVFVEGLGCRVGAECDPYEFDCGKELCLAPEHFCDVTIPGPKGPTNYECVDMPAACDGNYSCACLDAEGLVAPGECDEELKVGAITVTTGKP